jgi:hypothetical protein
MNFCINQEKKMKPKSKFLLKLSLLVIVVILLVGCNMPGETDQAAQQTAAAQTVDASVQEQPTNTPEPPIPTETTAPDSEGGDQGGTQSGEITPTVAQEASPTPTQPGDEIGDDVAEFIADITIPDYSEFKAGETITKTWRVRNSGTTTWTTDYTVVFEKGEKLGAPNSINLPKSVGPNQFVDISIEFTVPSAAGEYSSYWNLKNPDGQKVGVAEEGKYFTMFMIIQSVDETDDGGTSTSGGIAGGAKITNATVSVDKPNFSGSCPAQLTFTYTVTTSKAGKVNFHLKFNALSPSGYVFDAPPEYTVNFTGGYTVTYTYTLFSSDSVNATVKVEAVGSNTFTSAPVSFKVKCN